MPKLILVDNESSFLSTAKAHLENAGIQVDCCADVSLAYEAVKSSNAYFAAVVDISMNLGGAGIPKDLKPYRTRLGLKDDTPMAGLIIAQFIIEKRKTMRLGIISHTPALLDQYPLSFDGAKPYEVFRKYDEGVMASLSRFAQSALDKLPGPGDY